MRFIFFLLFSVSIFGQDFKPEHFTSENNQLKWVQIFQSKKSVNEISKIIQTQGDFETFVSAENRVKFKLNYSTSNFKPYGYNVWKFPTYLNGDSNCNGIIEFKDGRYRVTIQKINVSVFNPVTNDMQSADISDYVIKKDKIKSKKHVTKVLSVFEQYFNAVFSIKKTNQKDDW